MMTFCFVLDFKTEHQVSGKPLRGKLGQVHGAAVVHLRIPGIRIYLLAVSLLPCVGKEMLCYALIVLFCVFFSS